MSGAALVLAGPLTLLPGVILWGWAVRGPLKLAVGSGGFFGFGAGMLVLLGQAAVRCTIDQSCSQPDLSSWVGIATGFLILGTGVGIAAAPQAD